MLWIPCEAAIWDYGAHRGIVTDIYVEADAWILSLRWRLENAVLYAVWTLKNAVYLLLKIDILYAAWRRLRWDKKDWYIIYITCKILWLICCWLIYIIAALERLLPAWRPAVELWAATCVELWPVTPTWCPLSMLYEYYMWPSKTTWSLIIHIYYVVRVATHILWTATQFFGEIQSCDFNGMPVDFLVDTWLVCKGGGLETFMCPLIQNRIRQFHVLVAITLTCKCQ